MRGASWGTLAAVGVIGLVGLLLYSSRSPQGGATEGRGAPGFRLASTAGGTVSLSDHRGHDVLLYFNEGVGCDACFYQMVELEQNGERMAEAGLTVLPIVVNPAPDVRRELVRFGIRTPYLIDEGARISQAYGMLGKGMHAHLPGHGFVLVDGEGTVRWAMEYPTMFVSSDDLLAAVRPYLG